jgi:hypothetical protein
MSETLPFRLSIDHTQKRLVLVMKADDRQAQANLDMEEIAHFMAVLSQCQLALVQALRGHQATLPLDPETAFAPASGPFALAAHEGLPRLSVGDSPATGEVVVTLQGSSGRITCFRTLPETARKLANNLLKAAAIAEETSSDS